MSDQETDRLTLIREACAVISADDHESLTWANATLRSLFPFDEGELSLIREARTEGHSFSTNDLAYM